MATTTMSYALLFAVGLTGAMGEISVYKWGTGRQLSWLIASYGMVLLCVTLLGLFFRYGRFTFGPAIIVALAVHGLSCLACDHFQFGNRLTGIETLGIAFAAVSMILFEVGRPSTIIESVGQSPQTPVLASECPATVFPDAAESTQGCRSVSTRPVARTAFTRTAQPVVTFRQAQAIAEVHGTPTMVYSRTILQRNYETMRLEMPGVELFFAAKANPDHGILRNLFEFGSSVDICSYREMQAAMDAGFKPQQMIHTHPCKTIANLVDCYAEGLQWFTFDAPSEIAKFVKHTPDANLILRLAANSQSSLIDLSSKFGCPPADAAQLLLQANQSGLTVKALSFHVGSQCLDPADFRVMLRQARGVWDEGIRIGIPLEVLDIGGGFPAPYTAEIMSLERYCRSLQVALNDIFGDVRDRIRVIAEPGRGLVAECATLIVRVIGKSSRGVTTQYVIDDGLYGAFSGMVYDHAQFLPLVENAEHRFAKPCTIAGPTCDSGDILFRDQMLPDLEVGELLLIPTMGAYSSASASGFNGLDLPRYVEIT